MTLQQTLALLPQSHSYDLNNATLRITIIVLVIHYRVTISRAGGVVHDLIHCPLSVLWDFFLIIVLANP